MTDGNNYYASQDLVNPTADINAVQITWSNPNSSWEVITADNISNVTSFTSYTDNNFKYPNSVNTAVLINNQNQLYITTHDSRWQITNNWTPYINPDTDAYYLAEETFDIDFDK